MSKIKKIYLVLGIALVCALICGSIANARASASTPILKLISDYKHQEEIDVVNLGPVPISLLKMVTRIQADSSDKSDIGKISALAGIKRIIIMDYEDANEQARNDINTRLARILEKCELMMEASDDGDKMSIYGTEKKGKFTELILYTPSDCALIYIFGSIDPSALNLLAK